MDTGGKIATGILVPLAIGAAVVGGIYTYNAVTLYAKKKEVKKHKRERMDITEEDDPDDYRLYQDGLRVQNNARKREEGGKRRTHRRRR